MAYQITEGSEVYEIEPTDFVECVAIRQGFAQEKGELIEAGQSVNLPGSVFANGKISWLKIVNVYGAKKVETVEIDTSKKKVPKTAKE